MTDIAERLLTIPPADLRIERLAVLDWYDGPIEGYLEIADPGSCWHFEVVAAAYRDKGAADRHYALSAAPDDVFDHLREFLEPAVDRAGPGAVLGHDRGPLGGRPCAGPAEAAAPRSGGGRALTLRLNVTAVWQFSVG
ncbi:hypothetical protein ILP97_31640 [Amycolatopsis sp. H6(2020)]|nr:hypothetical protein [Amycolatopsis sp. H6(2020)]